MSRTPDPFESPKRRLKRGKEHARRLEKRIATFLKKKPYERIEDVDAEGFTTHAVKFTRDFPDSWVDAAVESIEALRSALDQAGYAAAVLGGVEEPKNAYFPIADKIVDLDGVVKGRCRDIPAEVRALFRSFDAHEGGNYALWALNKLCGANKHRLLLPIGALAPSVNIGQAIIQGGGNIFPPRWNREKRQLEFARIGPGGQFQYNVQITFFIGFDEFNGVKPGPAVGVLDLLASEADKVISATEAKCREIGLL
jgi:hypothetical protein